MSGKWLVHRHGQSFGPWSAGEVREELRQGTIDPFDLVSREGSQVMLELIEVDEIFQPDTVEYSEPNDAATILTPVLPHKEKPAKKVEEPESFMALAEPNLASRIRSSAKNAVAQTRGGRGRRKKPIGTNLFFKKSVKEKERETRKKSDGNISYELAKKSMSADVGQGSNLKKYFLIDGKGRIFGPKSASEIQGMYYRGIIGSDVFVKKNQSETSVPVAKFVEIYAHAKGAGRSSPVIGHHPAVAPGTMMDGAPTSRFEMIGDHAAVGMKALHRSRYMIAISAFILLCAVGIGVYTSKSAQVVSQLTDGTSQNSSQSVRSKRLKKKSKGSKATVKKVQKTQPKPVVARKPKVKKKLAAKKAPAKKAPANRSAFARRKYTPSKRTIKRSNRVTPIRPKRTRRGLSALATIRASKGKVVTAGPLRFNPADLNNCTLKCSVRMLDSAGISIDVKFFRAAFGSRLVGKSSKVYVTGRVAPNGKSLFLQAVK